MNIFHRIIQKTLIATFVFCFSVVSLYIPHLFAEVPKVEASGAIAGATEPTQWLNQVQLFAINGFSSLTAVATPISAAMNTSQFFLDNVLDGIAWSLAKNIISQMTSSIVNWVNSGFKGSPAFVQDLGGFLEQAADRAVGEYLEELGGPFSFICSPFKLDVRVALAVVYDQARAGSGNTGAPSCTLTGAMANIEQFLDGTQTFTEAGGWENWFTITSSPRTYTPFGSALTVTNEANARLVNQKGEALAELNFGAGFMASKICQPASSAANSIKEDCVVSTPGRVIADTLNKQLGAGTDSLIQADEINEIISAVFGQLANKAITGAAGLLGLSGGTGHSYSGTPFTEQIANSGLTQNPERLLNLMQESRQNEQDLFNLAELYRPLLQNFAFGPDGLPARKAEALNALETIDVDILPFVESNLIALDNLITRFQSTQYSPPFTGTLTVNPTELSAITQEFNDLDQLHSRIVVQGYENTWRRILE